MVSIRKPAGLAPPSDPYARARHARYIETGITYHVISRTNGNLFLLRPDRRGRLRRIVAGILAQARVNYPSVANFATVVMSNHLHAVLQVRQGDPRILADYIAFVKRELTRRWKHYVDWEGSIWGGYRCTALISRQAELNAFDYTLSQGVKEGLLSDPRDWPGFHCARSLASGNPERGEWFNGTAYGKAFHAEAAKRKPREVQRRDFVTERSFAFDPLPALGHLTGTEYRDDVRRRIKTIVADGRRMRDGRRPLGVAAICATDPRASAPVPRPPWFEDRRRMIVWDDPRKPEVREYVARYWQHQRSYRTAARAWLSGADLDVRVFPRTAFVPGFRPRPIAHMEQGTA